MKASRLAVVQMPASCQNQSSCRSLPLLGPRDAGVDGALCGVQHVSAPIPQYLAPYIEEEVSISMALALVRYEQERQ